MLGLFVIGMGATFYFFQRGERLHNIGLVLMGLGCIFMGLYWMKEGTRPAQVMPEVMEVFKSLDATTAWGFAKCVLLSLVFTAVVQSSSAMSAIVITLTQQGMLSFETAAVTVFGMNIGTTVTAWLAARDCRAHIDERKFLRRQFRRIRGRYNCRCHDYCSCE
jgi:phosphate:Na+ symporter